eukprot:GHVS01081858.1.p3 GENE.GHVS01081858.1~~GHVS01081858.1.p3  ORF type:complete len:108 (-),score=1.31 GHVS01081858.1:574-897(-)
MFSISAGTNHPSSYDIIHISSLVTTRSMCFRSLNADVSTPDITISSTSANSTILAPLIRSFTLLRSVTPTFRSVTPSFRLASFAAAAVKVGLPPLGVDHITPRGYTL